MQSSHQFHHHHRADHSHHPSILHSSVPASKHFFFLNFSSVLTSRLLRICCTTCWTVHRFSVFNVLRPILPTRWSHSSQLTAISRPWWQLTHQTAIRPSLSIMPWGSACMTFLFRRSRPAELLNQSINHLSCDFRHSFSNVPQFHIS